jgi:hypothetical protein
MLVGVRVDTRLGETRLGCSGTGFTVKVTLPARSRGTTFTQVVVPLGRPERVKLRALAGRCSGEGPWSAKVPVSWVEVLP